MVFLNAWYYPHLLNFGPDWVIIIIEMFRESFHVSFFNIFSRGLGSGFFCT